MPAYVQHRDIETALIVCPNCLGLPVYVRDVAPHWGMAKIDFIYECSDCGAEIKKTLTKPERRHQAEAGGLNVMTTRIGGVSYSNQ